MRPLVIEIGRQQYQRHDQQQQQRQLPAVIQKQRQRRTQKCHAVGDLITDPRHHMAAIVGVALQPRHQITGADAVKKCHVLILQLFEKTAAQAHQHIL